MIKKDIELLLNNLRDVYNSVDDDVKKIIHLSFRNILYMISESRPSDFISNAANDIWIKSGISGDLHNLLVTRKRAIQKYYPELTNLVLEHCVPISELFFQFMENNKSVKYVFNNLKTAWITKNENIKLNKKYKSKRKNWKLCYAECGIELEQ